MEAPGGRPMLRSPLSETTWVLWRYDWPFEAGPHGFEVRCSGSGRHSADRGGSAATAQAAPLGYTASTPVYEAPADLIRSPKLWAGLGLSVVLIALFLTTVDIGRMLDALAGANYSRTSRPRSAMYLISVLFRTLRWQTADAPHASW